MVKHLLSLLAILGYSLSAQVESLPDFPSLPFDDGVHFEIDGAVYVGTGLSSNFTTQRRFFKWDGQWTEVAPLPPGKERQYAVAWADQDYGYVFGGINDTNYLNDLWRYDPDLNQWDSLTPLPAAGRSGSAGMLGSHNFFIIGGVTQAGYAVPEIWAYSSDSDTWSQMPDMSIGGRWRMTYSLNGISSFLGLGRDSAGHYRNEIYYYTPGVQPAWSLLTRFPAAGLSHASMQYYRNHLYVFGGMDSTGSFSNNIWRYSFSDLSWEIIDQIPDKKLRGGLMWISEAPPYYESMFYVGGLQEDLTRTNEFWRYSFAPGILSPFFPTVAYPNPVSEFLVVQSSFPIQRIELINMLGQLVEVWDVPDQKFYLIDTLEIIEENYVLRVSTTGSVTSEVIRIYH